MKKGITSTFTHYSFLHLVFNMGSLWSYGYLELNNIIYYLKITLILIIMSFLIQILFYKILIEKFEMTYYRTVNCIGYSGVVFGLMTIGSMITKGNRLLGLPLSYMPFLSLMITQLIVPQASLLGHLSGIIVGYSIHFGLFNWFSNFLFFSSIFWIFILFIFSLRKNLFSSISIDDNSNNNVVGSIQVSYQIFFLFFSNQFKFRMVF